MEMKKGKKLYAVFIVFLVRFCIQTVILAVIMLLFFGVLLRAGIVLPATYAQNQLEQSGELLKSSSHIEESMLPPGCKYGVYNEKGEYVYGTFSAEEETSVWQSWETSKASFVGKWAYRGFVRDNGETCLVGYQILAQFSNPFLQKHVPNAEYLSYFIFFILFILQTIWLARTFGKYMTKRLVQLNHLTQQIQEENLDFNREHCDIVEIDNVFGSLFKMKEALKTSLEEQWAQEERKKEQVAALAHDIKTPLTVIRGNAELIAETAEDRTVKEYNAYITESVGSIEEYLILLQEMLRSETTQPIEKVEVDAEIFVQEVITQAEILAKSKQLELISHVDKLVGQLLINEKEMNRAVMNIVANAVEHSREKGSVILEVKQENNGAFTLAITDSGTGFTLEELKRAKEQFYQSDKSRHSNNHYGMGLYIADSFVKKQGGTLVLSNSEITGGAQVVIKMQKGTG